MREIRPELKPVHPARQITLRHFLVDDAASGGHPLDIAGADCAAVTNTIAMFNCTCEDLGDRFDPAVRVPGESGKVIRRNIIPEIIEEKERIEVRCCTEAESAAKMDAGALEGRPGLDNAFNRSKRHRISSKYRLIRAVT